MISPRGNVISVGSVEAREPAFVWHNGNLVPWEKATVHVTDLAYSSVSLVFDVTKAYRSITHAAVYLFRLQAHIDRFFQSMKVFRMRPELTPERVSEGIIEVLRANEYQDDTAIHTLAYWKGGGLGRAFSVPEPDRHVEIVILAWPASSRLDQDVSVRCCVSSWNRLTDNTSPPRVKAAANYAGSRLAYGEAVANGYDSAIMLTPAGKVAEAIGSCIFLLRNGRLITPDVTSGILESITRDSAIQLARGELKIPVEERAVDRTELYVADEIFLAGTSLELVPVISVDRIPIGTGEIGQLTRNLRALYETIVRGGQSRYEHWLTAVPVGTLRSR